MMQLTALVKVLIKENFSLKRLFGFELKGNRGKTILISLAIIYGIGAIWLSLGIMFFDLGAVLQPFGQLDALISFAYVYAFAMVAIMTLLRTNAYLFQYKDYQILAPLPLKPATVMFAKLIVMMLILYVTTLFITLPIVFCYFYYQGLALLPILFFIIGFLLIPLLPIAFISFLSLLVSLISSKLRFKNLLTILLSVGLIVAYVIFSIRTASNPEDNPLLGQVGAIQGIAVYYWPMAWFGDAVANGSLTSLLWLLLSHVGVFVIFIFVVARLAVKTNQIAQVTTIYRKGGPYKVISQGTFKTLIIKEFRKFFQTPMYALNSGIGLVFLIILSMGALFYKEGIGQLMPELTQAGLSPSLGIVVIVGFCIAMTYTPAISLSLEGKNIWIIKSLPLAATKIVVSKIAFNLLLVLPVSVLALILFNVAFGFNWLLTLVLIIWGVAFGVLTSLFGAMLNLLFPKINFSNEIEVIKQSVASLFAVFGGFALIAANAVPLVFLAPMFGEVLTILILISGCLLLSGLIYLFIHKKAEHYLRRI